jgi:hypothetical protein
MVTFIKFGKSLRATFNYNENKVKAGVAEIIHTANYGKDTDELSSKDRIVRLERLAGLNERTLQKSAHITINFHTSERLDKETIQQITDTYMKMIGFGGQPYIVYEHKDAGHQHVHILSTLIRPDGTRIPTYHIGKDRSEPARQAIEQEYNLVRAQGYHLGQPYQTRDIETQKVQYGRNGTLRAILVVLEAVLAKYRFTSLAEFNAVLRNYNVIADDGFPGSRMRQRHGLVYRALDEQGNKVGTHIKASDLYNKPTLRFLESLFAKNAALRPLNKAALQQAIDYILMHEPPLSIEGLGSALKRQSIQLVIQRGERGMIHGLTYIDHKSGAIFNGSDLGMEYSSGRVMERIAEKAISPLHRGALEYFMPERARQPLFEKPSPIKPIVPVQIIPSAPVVLPEHKPEPKEELEKKTKKKRKRLHL